VIANITAIVGPADPATFPSWLMSRLEQLPSGVPRKLPSAYPCLPDGGGRACAPR
jgi:hypothetical protein